MFMKVQSFRQHLFKSHGLFDIFNGFPKLGQVHSLINYIVFCNTAYAKKQQHFVQNDELHL